MTKVRKCAKCQKEITSGKYYNFFVGKKGYKEISEYQEPGNNFFCPPCAEKEKNDPDNTYSQIGAF